MLGAASAVSHVGEVRKVQTGMAQTGVLGTFITPSRMFTSAAALNSRRQRSERKKLLSLRSRLGSAHLRLDPIIRGEGAVSQDDAACFVLFFVRVAILGRGDDTVGNPHRAQTSQFEFFEFVPLLKLCKKFPVEQFEATTSQSTVPPLAWLRSTPPARAISCCARWVRGVC